MNRTLLLSALLFGTACGEPLLSEQELLEASITPPLIVGAALVSQDCPGTEEVVGVRIASETDCLGATCRDGASVVDVVMVPSQTGGRVIALFAGEQVGDNVVVDPPQPSRDCDVPTLFQSEFPPESGSLFVESDDGRFCNGGGTGSCFPSETVEEHLRSLLD